METVIVALVAIALILFGVMELSQTALLSVDTVGMSWRDMEDLAEERARTQLSLVDTSSQGAGAIVEATLANDGTTKLGSFTKWDVMIQYYDSSGNYHIGWLPYTTGEPVDNQWTVEGIFMEAPSQPEIFEPGMLNPGEQVVIKARISPSAVVTETMMVVSTPNGVTASIVF